MLVDDVIHMANETMKGGRKMCFLTRTPTTTKKEKKKEKTQPNTKSILACDPFILVLNIFLPRQPTPTNYAPLLSPTKPSNMSTMWRWF